MALRLVVLWSRVSCGTCSLSVHYSHYGVLSVEWLLHTNYNWRPGSSSSPCDTRLPVPSGDVRCNSPVCQRRSAKLVVRSNPRSHFNELSIVNLIDLRCSHDTNIPTEMIGAISIGQSLVASAVSCCTKRNIVPLVA